MKRWGKKWRLVASSCSGRDNSLPCPRNFFVAHHNFASVVFPLFPRSGTVHLERFFVTHTKQHLISHYRFRKVLYRVLHRFDACLRQFFRYRVTLGRTDNCKAGSATRAYVCLRMSTYAAVSRYFQYCPRLTSTLRF